MNKLLQIAGILLVALGIALGLLILFSPGSMQVIGLTFEVASIFLVGGILSVGLGSVVSAIAEASRMRPAMERSVVERSSVVYADPEPAVEPPARPAAGARLAAAAAAAAANEATAKNLSPEVSETIAALDKAKSELQQAFDEKPAAEPVEPEAMEDVHVAEVEEPAEAHVEPVDEEPDAALSADDQLYVVEERIIRRHPARILSDGTVEAETAEGWMRFENLEHLDEYLDAMEPSA